MKKFLLYLATGLFLTSGSPINKVDFKAPVEWTLLDQRNSDSISVYLYLVKKVQIGSQLTPSNAIMRCYFVPPTVTIEDADRIVAAHSNGAYYVLSAKDGPHWKTYLLVRHEDDEQLVLLYRIGIYHGIILEFVLVFPNDFRSTGVNKHMQVLTLTENPALSQNMAGICCSPEYVKPFLDAFNSVCTSMKIEDDGEFNAKAELVDLPTDAKYFRDTTLAK